MRISRRDFLAATTSACLLSRPTQTFAAVLNDLEDGEFFLDILRDRFAVYESGGVAYQNDDRTGISFLHPDEIFGLRSSVTEAAIGFGQDLTFHQSVIDGVQRGDVDLGRRDGPLLYPQLADDPDGYHLGGFSDFFGIGGVFTLTADVLERLAEANAFDLDERHKTEVDVDTPIIFGLRGCGLRDEAAAATFSGSLALSLREPDHSTYSCVIGVWRRSTGEVMAVKASTVPSEGYARIIFDDPDELSPAKRQKAGVSLLPTGLYRYRPGVFPKAGGRSAPDRAALLIGNRDYPVLRSPYNLGFNARDEIDVWTAGNSHHIHRARRGASASVAAGSAGCQIVPDAFDLPRGLASPWANLRLALGIVDRSGNPAGLLSELSVRNERSPDPRQRVYQDASGKVLGFRYMLMTGREALLAANRHQDYESNARRLRFGSSGPSVKQFQEDWARRLRRASSDPDRSVKLVRGGAEPDGIFGQTVGLAALLESKRVNGTALSPIVIL